MQTDYNQCGFDVVHNTEDPRAGEWLDWVRGEHPEHYGAALATSWTPDVPELKSYGSAGEDLSEAIRAARAKTSRRSDAVPNGDPQHYELPFPEEVSQSEWITAHVGYVQFHTPYFASRRFFDLVNVDAIPVPIAATWAEDPSAPVCFKSASKFFVPPPSSRREQRHCYFADIAHSDCQLGNILDALEEDNALVRTMIFLLSDDGDLLFDYGFPGSEEKHYDACIRIPFMVAGRGGRRRGRS